MQHKLVAGTRYLAALAGIALLATACGSGGPAAGSGASSPANLAVALGQFVQCMHTRGQRGIYLSRAPASPPPPGTTLIVYHGFAIQGADQNSARFPAAMTACRRLLPHGTPPSAAELHQAFINGVKAAQCMRSHGYPTWPDPPTGPNAYDEEAVPPRGIDTSSRPFQAAAKACGVLLPSAGG